MKKNNLVKTSFFLLLFSCLLSVFSVQGLSAQISGLSFKGQEEVLDNRTELQLTPEEPIIVDGELEVGFDLKIKPTIKRTYGYVFRIVDQNGFNIDLINSFENGQLYFYIVHGEEGSVMTIPIEESCYGKWEKWRLKLMPNQKKLILYSPDSFYVEKNLTLKKKNKYDISFGASTIKGFSTTDVSAMSLKDVKISINGKLSYYWSLARQEGDIVYDQVSKQLARIRNPLWLKKEHSEWAHQFSVTQWGSVIITSDKQSNRIFLIGEETMLIYSMIDNKVNQIKYQNKPTIKLKGCQAVYHQSENKIIIYDVDEKQFFKLDLSGKWSGEPSKRNYETTYLHHNKYFNEKDQTIITFGGYGRHKYKNMVQFLNVEGHKDKTFKPANRFYSPRYMAAIGALNDTIYLFGGFGSKTGNQLINPKSNYDLLSFSLKDSVFAKRHQVNSIISDMSLAHSLFINEKDRSFYALAFDKSITNGVLQLIKGSLDSSEISLLGSTVPFKFADINTYVDLIYSEIQDKLYTVTTFLNDENKTEVEVYAINYPPNAYDEEGMARGEKNANYLLIVLLAIVFIILLAILLIRRKKQKVKSIGVGLARGGDEVLVHQNNKVLAEEEVADERTKQPKEGYHVIFFGGFQIINAEKIDITNKFTPLLKELFLLVWLYSYKNNKGIQSDNISEILWPDKTEKSAKNNRAVNFAKLRALLSELGDVELSKKTGYWKIVHNESELRSDYLEFLQLTESKVNLNEAKVEQLIEVIKKGAFLRNVEYEWLDDFKAAVSDRLIESLVSYLENNSSANLQLNIKIANCIFYFDVINEEALIMKCKAQCLLGQHGLAKKTYENFSKEYLKLYGEEYSQAFTEIAG